MLKNVFKSISILLVAFLLLVGFNDDVNNVYLIPIEGEINKASHRFIQHSLNSLDFKENDVVIFKIDTYGGLIDEAIKIKDLIIDMPVRSVAYINNKALSAGVLISIAAEKIYMNETAVIGSAETIPNDEKVLSMWRGVLRDTAQYRNRDHLLIEAMADKDIGIENVVQIGKLLNLTASEALELGLIDDVVNDYASILDDLNIESQALTFVNESLEVKLAKYISTPLISSILLTFAFIGLIIEILTPGFGLGGIVSVISFGLYFGGNLFAGYANLIALILFMVGIIFVGVSIVIPGFGLPELLSVFFIFSGIIMANYSFEAALIALSVAIIVSTILTIILVRLGFKSQHLRRIVLDNQHDATKGYLATNHMEAYLNQEGIALSELRPSGSALINDERVDVLALGGFIEKDSLIVVERVEGFKVFVRRK